MSHLKEIDDLIVQFRGGSRPIASVIEVFSLDNGREWLERYFETVQLHRQENALLINDAAALAAFGLSVTRAGIAEDRQTEFAKYVEQTMHAHKGEMRIAKDGGLFIGVKAYNPPLNPSAIR